MLCVKFGWNWTSGSRVKDFLILSMYFRYFVIISLWKRAGPFIWTNLNPLHPRKFVPSLVANGSVVQEKKIFWFRKCFCYFLIISPWNKAGTFFLIPFTQGCFVPSLVEIGSVVLEKNMKMWKVYKNNDDNYDDGQRTNFDLKTKTFLNNIQSLWSIGYNWKGGLMMRDTSQCTVSDAQVTLKHVGLLLVIWSYVKLNKYKEGFVSIKRMFSTPGYHADKLNIK